jgi:predicted homoserine dehydrogenase-like protein
VRPVPKGQTLLCSDVSVDTHSTLYTLRQSQDQHFFPAP